MDRHKFGHRPVLGVGLALLCLGLAGCVDDMAKPLSPTFGDAVRQNMARQIVNPEPAMPSEQDVAVDGNKAVLGVDAYKAGKVKTPVVISTQTQGTGSGSSSSK
jgi:type IV pilus biogenesis protein CpaD/CtpE